jgi:hypothetical protein
VVALLTLETNHFTFGSQSSFAQQLDYFPRREDVPRSFNQRCDYLILSHHVDCFRIDTAARPDFYWLRLPLRQNRTQSTTENSNERPEAERADHFTVG